MLVTSMILAHLDLHLRCERERTCMHVSDVSSLKIIWIYIASLSAFLGYDVVLGTVILVSLPAFPPFS